MDWVTWVQSPVEVKYFSSTLCIQPALGPTQPPVQWVLEILLMSKCSQGMLLTTHPLPVPQVKRGAIPPLPQMCQNWCTASNLYYLQYPYLLPLTDACHRQQYENLLFLAKKENRRISSFIAVCVLKICVR
jgi:hypothetical protein